MTERRPGTARKKIAVIVGTRPEAVKMAPVVAALRKSAQLAPWLVSTGQHRELLDSALRPLGLTPDVDLAVMSAGQTPNQVLARVVERIGPLLEAEMPHAVLVQGDTTTVLGASLAAYHLRIPLGHVEAGLRTYDHDNPFPEEANRQLADRLARWCFAPTARAKECLLSERIDPARVFVTGNTVIDALLQATERSSYRCAPDTVLVTLHRRESFGDALTQVLLGLRDFLDQTPHARALWPVHPNPSVLAARQAALAGVSRVECVAPLDYLDFAGALASCRIVLTDSGGLQEEAPSLGKPVLVARDVTERPEALGTGQNRLVGRSRERVRDELVQAFHATPYEGPLPAPSPFGDGHAAERIVNVLESELA